MSDERRLKWLKVFVLTGILLGYLGYGVRKLTEVKELFPFADWRLYSMPLGVNEPVTVYRIYTRDPNSEIWSRRPVRATENFTLKEYSYVLGFWSSRVQLDSDDRHKERLGVAVRALEPGATDVRVVAETFYSLPLYVEPTEYDTTTLVRYRW